MLLEFVVLRCELGIAMDTKIARLDDEELDVLRELLASLDRSLELNDILCEMLRHHPDRNLFLRLNHLIYRVFRMAEEHLDSVTHPEDCCSCKD